MTKHLLIAGHGMTTGGIFDPGASLTGISGVRIGEHEYFSKLIFPKMREHVHPDDNDNLILFDDYNVFSKNNIVDLARSYGNDTVVHELHFDSAANTRARGGHVIIYNQFKPDGLDLRINQAIFNTVGLNSNYVHRNIAGISGRSNLRNLNACARAGVNYRLSELGFGSNTEDAKYMYSNAKAIAIEYLIAHFGRYNKKEEEEAKTMWRVVIGSYQDRDNADDALRLANDKGFDDAFIIPFEK